MKRIILALSVAGVATLIATPLVHASDAADSPSVMSDPSADITDLFTWTSGTKTYLVMDVFPQATTASKFSSTSQYVFHTSSMASRGMPETKVDVMCTFDVSQAISCWAGSEYVHGDPSATSGLTSTSGKLKVFAGLRDDPFFFNLDGFHGAQATVKGASASFTYDAAGCPAIGSGASATILKQLSTNPVDAFAGKNVLAIVLELDTTLLTTGGPLVTVWASTNH